MSALATDPVLQREAVTANSRERPMVPALRKPKFWENPAPVCSAMTDLSPVDNVNIEMHACANGLNTRRHICCRLDTFHPKGWLLVSVIIRNKGNIIMPQCKILSIFT